MCIDDAWDMVNVTAPKKNQICSVAKEVFDKSNGKYYYVLVGYEGWMFEKIAFEPLEDEQGTLKYREEVTLQHSNN